MKEMASEFCRPVQIGRLGAEPFRQRIEASAEEREKLARRFDLVVLDRLVAEVELRRQSADVILLEARFEAAFAQCCAVTLEPVRGEVTDCFSLVYGPAPHGEEEIALSGEGPAFEVLDGEAIDIGEAVAQELSLALPAFPRHPDAVIDAAAPAETLTGPFAMLRVLRKDAES
jgi:uncharacterized metal-binding protein YceD (DUF177 family)